VPFVMKAIALHWNYTKSVAIRQTACKRQWPLLASSLTSSTMKSPLWLYVILPRNLGMDCLLSHFRWLGVVTLLSWRAAHIQQILNAPWLWPVARWARSICKNRVLEPLNVENPG
jgi:hypothetical protein